MIDMCNADAGLPLTRDNYRHGEHVWIGLTTGTRVVGQIQGWATPSIQVLVRGRYRRIPCVEVLSVHSLDRPAGA